MRVSASTRDDANIGSRRSHEDDSRFGVARLEHRRDGLATEQVRHSGRRHEPPDNDVVAVDLRTDVVARAGHGNALQRGSRLRQVGQSTQSFERRRRVGEIPRCTRACTSFGREQAEGEVAQPGPDIAPRADRTR